MKDKSRITFTGDIGFSRYMSNRWKDNNLLSTEILEFFNNADHVVANVEGPLYKGEDIGNRGVFFHPMDPDVSDVLEKINVDVYSIANNHIMDVGIEGLLSTIDIAKKKGCQTIGAGINEEKASEPVYFDEAGGIGMFAVAYMSECVPADENSPGVFRWNNMSAIENRIREIKKDNRWCIMVVHGGEEFADMPNPYTRNRYLEYLRMGADIVVGHHPHVVENYELFDNKAIFYSLGNFIFDTDYQRVHPYTDKGVLLELELDEKSFIFNVMAIKIDRQKEIIYETDLPVIFTDISEKDYQLLSPLSSKMFLEEEKKRMMFLEPERFKNASDEEFMEYFNSKDIEGYDKGSHMDLSLVVENADKADNNDYLLSDKKDVIDYILRDNKLKDYD